MSKQMNKCCTSLFPRKTRIIWIRCNLVPHHGTTMLITTWATDGPRIAGG